MQLGRIAAQLGFAAMAMASLGGTVSGDVLNGHWCAEDGRRIVIDGRNITTPDGTRVRGEYGAHHVVFLMPGTGGHSDRREADVILLSDNLAYIRVLIGEIEDHATPPEVRKHCEDTTSSLLPAKRTL